MARYPFASMKAFRVINGSSSILLAIAVCGFGGCDSNVTGYTGAAGDARVVENTDDAGRSDGPSTSNTAGVDPDIVDDGSAFALVYAGLSKEKFLNNNWRELQRMVLRVNADLSSEYASARVFTTADLVLVLYSEMFISNGIINPNATHSEGERGLLPLPENITYWIGPDAPPWNVPHSIEDNVYAFLSYLGQVKNKDVRAVDGRTLYRDLFLFPGLADQMLPEATLVAGVIHGYFYSGAYNDGASVPYDSILQGLADGESLHDIMRGTGYKNATPERIYILEGRQRNIDAATVIWRDLRGI